MEDELEPKIFQYTLGNCLCHCSCSYHPTHHHTSSLSYHLYQLGTGTSSLFHLLLFRNSISTCPSFVCCVSFLYSYLILYLLAVFCVRFLYSYLICILCKFSVLLLNFISTCPSFLCCIKFVVFVCNKIKSTFFYPFFYLPCGSVCSQ